MKETLDNLDAHKVATVIIPDVDAEFAVSFI